MRITVRCLLFAVVVLAMSAASFSQVAISVRFGPPAIPVYEQPLCPGEGYIWTPGYWAYDYDDSDYYWVPGTWVVAPQVGFLWTPGYWGWGGGAFIFHEGYWGPRIGFYGGINYGFGYFGNGYEGGRWDHDRFFYNRSVNNINVTNIHNVYNTTVINNNVTRVSYNGGNGGINARPTSEQMAAANERHIPPVSAQIQHSQAARSNPEQRASVNHGSPAVAASARPGDFNGGGVVRARQAGAPYNPPGNRGQMEQRPNGSNPSGSNNVPRPGNPVHASDLSPHERPAPVNTGNPKVDQKYQNQQNKLYAQQERDHQRLQQQQDQEHQRMAQQNANDARKQQVEQKHQQQTQQMEQRHQQQQQHLQEKQPAGKNPQK